MTGALFLLGLGVFDRIWTWFDCLRWAYHAVCDAAPYLGVGLAGALIQWTRTALNRRLHGQA